MTPMSIAALFTKNKLRKHPMCPLIDEWIKNMWHVYIVEGYSAIKKKECNFPICNNMDGSREYNAK